jgi:hypothetical protein
MLLGIDHLVIAVPDLDLAAERCRTELGLDAVGGGVHPGLGTANRLVWLGDSFLELIAIADRDKAAESWLGAPTLRLIDEQGGGFVTYALASDDVESDVARLWSGRSALVGPLPGERRRADGEVVRWMLAVPPVVGPTAPPFLIEHDEEGAEWRPADRAGRARLGHPIGGGVRLRSVKIDAVDPPKVAEAYRMTVGLAFSSGAEGALWTTVGEQRIALRWADGGPGPSVTVGLSVSGGPGASADLFGCRIVIEAG